MASINHTTIEFLSRLWQGGNYSYYWTTPDKISRWFPVEQPVSCPNGNRNVYFGVNPVVGIPPTNHQGEPKPPQYIRSQNNYIQVVNCLFGEFDFKDWQNADRIKDHLKQFPYPSIVNFSGGGYHCFWLLADSFFIRTEADREYIRQAQANWVAFTDSDPQSKDIARVLRVPGTRNYKPSYGPNFPTVAIIKARYSLAYDLAYLADMSQPEPVEVPELPDIDIDPTCNDVEYFGRQALNTAQKMIYGAVIGQRHGIRLRAARLLGGYIAGGLVCESDAIQVLESDLHHPSYVGDRKIAERTIRGGIQYGLAYPITLEDKLRQRELWREQNGTRPPSARPEPDCKQFWANQFVGFWEKVR